ncbi:hypothetical protein LZ31DRAFT_125434 [Colletotrichum somersetense]|nr:hypothetical protein LZ31DRAFT_125434 [Colletotrichum somersetense]
MRSTSLRRTQVQTSKPRPMSQKHNVEGVGTGLILTGQTRQTVKNTGRNGGSSAPNEIRQEGGGGGGVISILNFRLSAHAEDDEQFSHWGSRSTLGWKTAIEKGGNCTAQDPLCNSASSATRPRRGSTVPAWLPPNTPFFLEFFRYPPWLNLG